MRFVQCLGEVFFLSFATCLRCLAFFCNLPHPQQVVQPPHGARRDLRALHGPDAATSVGDRHNRAAHTRAPLPFKFQCLPSQCQGQCHRVLFGHETGFGRHFLMLFEHCLVGAWPVSDAGWGHGYVPSGFGAPSEVLHAHRHDDPHHHHQPPGRPRPRFPVPAGPGAAPRAAADAPQRCRSCRGHHWMKPTPRCSSGRHPGACRGRGGWGRGTAGAVSRGRPAAGAIVAVEPRAPECADDWARGDQASILKVKHCFQSRWDLTSCLFHLLLALH